MSWSFLRAHLTNIAKGDPDVAYASLDTLFWYFLPITECAAQYPDRVKEIKELREELERKSMKNDYEAILYARIIARLCGGGATNIRTAINIVDGIYTRNIGNPSGIFLESLLQRAVFYRLLQEKDKFFSCLKGIEKKFSEVMKCYPSIYARFLLEWQFYFENFTDDFAKAYSYSEQVARLSVKEKAIGFYNCYFLIVEKQAPGKEEEAVAFLIIAAQLGHMRATLELAALRKNERNLVEKVENKLEAEKLAREKAELVSRKKELQLQIQQLEQERERLSQRQQLFSVDGKYSANDFSNSTHYDPSQLYPRVDFSSPSNEQPPQTEASSVWSTVLWLLGRKKEPVGVQQQRSSNTQDIQNHLSYI